MAEGVPAKAWPRKTEAISGRIVPWDGAIGVGYVLSDGKQTAHPIKPDDWPIIARLEREGQLTYSSDAVRERAERERPPT
jgi:hypothetical protein